MLSLYFDNLSFGDKVLRVIGPYFIDLEKIHYIAVTKNNNDNIKSKFCIEFGIDKSLKQDLSNYLFDYFSNNKKELIGTLKKEFDFSKKLKTYNYNNFFKTTFINVETEVVDGFTTIDDSPTDAKAHDKLRGGIRISHKNLRAGTLGGIFKLEGYGDELFGISNWHVLARNQKLGSEIILPDFVKPEKTKEIENLICGKLFWKCHNKELEAAIVQFDYQKFKPDNINECGYKVKEQCETLHLYDEVTKCGSRTCCLYLDKKCTYGIAYSINASVKVNKNTYKNQILIKNLDDTRKFTNKGDSGALIVNKNYNVVALHFTATADEKFSVANNINNIFNKEFTQAQLVYYNGLIKEISKLKIKEFIN